MRCSTGIKKKSKLILFLKIIPSSNFSNSSMLGLEYKLIDQNYLKNIDLFENDI
jgi:hypothetical protein